MSAGRSDSSALSFTQKKANNMLLLQRVCSILLDVFVFCALVAQIIYAAIVYVKRKRPKFPENQGCYDKIV